MKYRFQLLGLLVLLVLPSAGLSQSKSTSSVQVNSIFIFEEVPDDSVRFNSGEFERRLKGLLRMGGIQTPDKIADADAELLIEPSVIVTLHGAKDDPDIMVYECKLVSKSRKEIWHVKQTFIRKEVHLENDIFAARRVAEKLLFALKRGKLKR